MTDNPDDPAHDTREPVFRSTITGRSREAMVELVRGLGIAVFEHTSRTLPSKKGFSVDAFLTDAQVQRLKAVGYGVKFGPDAHKVGRERQAEVGTGNRYEDQHPKG
jgi:hypothetical protein